MSKSYDEMKNKLKARDRIRLFGLIGYFVVMFAFSIYQMLTDFVRFNPALYLILMFGGSIVMLVVIYVYPYFKPIELPVVADREVIDLSEDYPLDEYYEKVRFKILYLWMVPIIVYFSVSSLLNLARENYQETMINAILVLVFILLIVWFEKMELVGSSEELLIKFGPFRNRIELSKIISSRPTAIKPWGTYLGYTKRVGSDGSIGYITGTTTGVRLEIEGKRNYVLSTHQPQVLVNYIRSMKQR